MVIGESTFETVGDDALLLHEFAHRTANEIAAAAAAVQLARRTGGDAGAALLARAADRLDAFATLHRLMARPVRGRTNVGADLATVCRAATANAAGGEVVIGIPDIWIDGPTARRLVLVAAELVANAVRHALQGRRGRLEVGLEVAGEDVVLTVADDGPGIGPRGGTSGTGLGRALISQLVSRAHGSMTCNTGPRGTTIRVALPLDPPVEDAAVAF